MTSRFDSAALPDAPAPTARVRGWQTATLAPVTWLSSVIGVLAVVASVWGLLPGGGAARTVTSIRGEPVRLYGHGLYQYDTVFIAEGSKAPTW